VDIINSVWQLGIIALIAGAMIGILAYRLLTTSEKEVDKIKSELDATRKELSEYKASVNQHFDKTSELVNDLTQNYVNVYRHLAEGAQTLGDGRTFNNLLEQHQGKVSLAVDDRVEQASGIVEDSDIDAVLPPVAPAQPVDEHAAPFDDVTANAPDSIDADTATAKADAPSPSDEASSPAAADAPESPEQSAAPDQAVEPVLNVEALDQAGESADPDKVSADAAKAASEIEETVEAGTTRH
jgi:uncharacterized membrane-anchored protein YhcB (DUF1043 family)